MPVVAVVAVPDDDPAQRSCLGSEERAAAVVFETDKATGLELGDVGLDDHVADEALVPRFGFHVDEADARIAFSVRRLVIVAEKLISAAHREYLRSLCHRTLERRLLELEQVFVDQRLLLILAAAEKEDVDLFHLFVVASA